MGGSLVGCGPAPPPCALVNLPLQPQWEDGRPDQDSEPSWGAPGACEPPNLCPEERIASEGGSVSAAIQGSFKSPQG